MREFILSFPPELVIEAERNTGVKFHHLIMTWVKQGVAQVAGDNTDYEGIGIEVMRIIGQQQP